MAATLALQKNYNKSQVKADKLESNVHEMRHLLTAVVT